MHDLQSNDRQTLNSMPREDFASHLAGQHLLMVKTTKDANLNKVAEAAINLCQVDNCHTWSVAVLPPELV